LLSYKCDKNISAIMRFPGGNFNGFIKLENELLQIKMETLARIAGKLREYLGSLERLQENIDREYNVDRPVLVNKYNSIRDLACRYRWYLEVQRDVMGLRNYRLDEFYYVPPKMK